MTVDPSTRRKDVRLPPMPAERDGFDKIPTASIARAHMTQGALVFDNPGGFDQALRQGFFFVAAPSEMDFAPGDLFARQFFKARTGHGDERYRGYRDVRVPGDYQGYFDREFDQWENFYIEMANWSLLPEEVARLGHQMTDLGIAIICDVMRRLGLPEGDWPLVTSGLSQKRGHQMLAFNHFRADKAMRGCKFHRDSGWVTVLRSHEPGLLAFMDGQLWAINPEPGHVIANFGSSMEVLTERLPTPVRASIHGVVRTQREPGRENRTSYVVFLDSSLDGQIYRYEKGRPRAVQSVADFAVQEVSRTYDDDEVSL